MTTLAIDPGTVMGWAAFEDDWPHERVGSGVVRLSTGAKAHPGERYSRLLDFLHRFDGFTISRVAYERVYFHASGDAAHVYGGICAIVFSWAHRYGIPVIEANVTAVKVHATGKGGASKIDMVEAANAAWNLGFTWTMREAKARARKAKPGAKQAPLDAPPKVAPVFADGCDNEADALWIGHFAVTRPR